MDGPVGEQKWDDERETRATREGGRGKYMCTLPRLLFFSFPFFSFSSER